ncbi:acyltransferase family protein [Rubellimicrobium arenae]|uniref:acyltransferase family protein n=1 Tax=Rubellimicrobium arenae TaxID=2817372 RepID=UPI001B301EC8|nr:acyltransferase family protein [Rubellimicrobium arenae]
MKANSERIDWIDTAKGASILLVVLWHSYLFARLGGDMPTEVTRLNEWLIYARMPLFFLASGILTAGLARRPIAQTIRKRVLPMVWILLVWTVIGSAIDAVVPLYPWFTRPLPGLGEILWSPQGELWFIYALLAYAVMAWLVLTQDGWRRLALLGGLFGLLAVNHLLREEFFTRSFALYYPFYMAGVLGAPYMRWATERGSRVLVVAAVCAGGLLISLALPLHGFTKLVVRSALGAGLGVAAAYGLQSLPAASAWMNSIGRRSLPIYLGHMPIMAILFALLPEPWMAAAPTVVWIGFAGIAVPAALMIEQVARSLGLGWLYAVPDPVVMRLREVKQAWTPG